MRTRICNKTLLLMEEMKEMNLVVPIQAEEYREGLEDDFVYHVAMFGFFTKQECLDSGFTPDFEKDKIPAIAWGKSPWTFIEKGDFIVTFRNGEREVWSSKDIFENCDDA